MPELSLKDLPNLKPPELLTKPSLDQIIVSFLSKECEVFIEPRNVGEWNGWDTLFALSSISSIFSGQENDRNIANTIFYANRSNQVSNSAEDWRTWKMWALEQEEFKIFKSNVINEIENYNSKILKKENAHIKEIVKHNKKAKQKWGESSTIKKIEEALEKFHKEKSFFDAIPKNLDLYNWTDYAIYRSLIHKPIPTPQMWDEFIKGELRFDSSDLIFDIFNQAEVFFDRELFTLFTQFSTKDGVTHSYYGPKVSISKLSEHGGVIDPGNFGAQKMQNAGDSIDKVKTIKLFLNTKKFDKSPVIRSRIDYLKIYNSVIDIYNLISPLQIIDIWGSELSESWIDFNNVLLKNIRKNDPKLLETAFNYAEEILEFDKIRILEINKNLRNDYWFIDMFQLFFDEKVLDVIYKTRKIPEFLNPKNLK